MRERAVRFADPVAQQGFTQIPNAILRDASLSAGARLTYAMLESFAWQDDECWVGQKKLGDLVGVKERAIHNYLKELEAAGLLEINQQGLNKPNHYVLFGADPDQHQRADPDQHQRADEEDSVEEDSVTSDRKQIKVNRKVVSDSEFTLAAAVVQLFNSSAGTALSVEAHLVPIVMRIREHPTYTEVQHRKIIEAVFAGEHWWSGPPGIEVIYGNAAQFEKSIELARAKAREQQAAGDSDPNAERRRVEEEFRKAEEEDAEEGG